MAARPPEKSDDADERGGDMVIVEAAFVQRREELVAAYRTASAALAVAEQALAPVARKLRGLVKAKIDTQKQVRPLREARSEALKARAAAALAQLESGAEVTELALWRASGAEPGAGFRRITREQFDAILQGLVAQAPAPEGAEA